MIIKKNYLQNDILFQDLIKTVTKNISKTQILNKITKAYQLAKYKHAGQKRLTGEDYIVHLVTVAKILSHLNVEPNTLMAGLLHDILEDTDLSFSELTNLMGEDIANLVKYVTKLDKLVFNQDSGQSDNHQKIFLAMAQDIRVVIIKIVDRLHNMQTLKSLRPEKQVRIAKETLEIYASLTHRLGLFEIKSELEDLCLRYINPQIYYHISELIKAKKREREIAIEKIITNIKQLFFQNNLNNFIIKGRVKNIYSIYKKMTKRNLSFSEIFDLFAIRIIVDNLDLCYQILGIIHANYFPIPLKFKDYIAVPKPNLYQSLHTTVLSKTEGILFEIQIRTMAMDEIAEKGIASHWTYKENKVYSKETKQLEIAKKLRWYNELIKITKDSDNYPQETSKEFTDAIKNDILSENVYVFTPKQKVLELPKGSTPIDFAFRIHTEIGAKMSGAIINGKITPLNYQLKNGDFVDIKTNKNVATINKEWLRIVKTIYAKRKIKHILYKYQNEDLISLGKELLEKEKQLQKIFFTIDNKFLKNNLKKYNFNSLNDFYLEIGKKNISPKLIFQQHVFKEDEQKKLLNHYINKSSQISNKKNKIGIIVDGLSNIKLKLANCCLPVLGDTILGFISKEQGVVIHCSECKNLKKYNKNKLVNVVWDFNVKIKNSTYLYIKCSKNISLLPQIMNKLNKFAINVVNLNVINNKFETIIKLKILVNNKQELDNLMINLRNFSNIHYISRNVN
ncbi:Guanosine-3'-5'-bis(diphosphate) 3'-pyrophosphohydrolase [Candidatus Phytoplasma mali]|uniref:Penta-phosphate guanosine-3'-pyrophosphohydrolase n=1 Tax=Phytoplasma mali (strain AT) TaxID=482235 RepID=B3R0K4_PHYMT|nr:RelA/SpoT family protein [Candidatus Phytoplasma mali]CAP18368.1 Guanosine-3'-5'-bis(diphosphate) 3'-pyrophosphohydrolase [Candidatus Phytoplasma mali]